MNVLITGGCGFIGCNTAERLLALGHRVTLFDNLSRPGTGQNLQWLLDRGNPEFIRGDVRDGAAMARAIGDRRYDALVHLAGQVAVTTSVADPRTDFEINAGGTLNVLEAVRLHSPETIVLFASTNKVYGSLDGHASVETATRYSLPTFASGVAEDQPLDFHSPYGCSKGAADQYVIDYARIYGLRTVTFRQSCIYGLRQLGLEDQGWVAWFIYAHTLGRQATIYGTGKQVRDVLFADDLVACYLAAIERIDRVAGMVLNIGGGPANTLSLLELLALLERLSGRPVDHRFADWRPGDQHVYVSNVAKAHALLGWQPAVGVEDGVGRLYRWIADNAHLLQHALARA
jgi:CDP-paratose 2-epimerase